MILPEIWSENWLLSSAWFVEPAESSILNTAEAVSAWRRPSRERGTLPVKAALRHRKRESRRVDRSAQLAAGEDARIADSERLTVQSLMDTLDADHPVM